MGIVAGVVVSPDDLTRVVDAVCVGGGALGIVEGGAGAAADAGVDEAVGIAGVAVSPDNLALAVDALCKGARGGERVVDRNEAIDGHLCSSAKLESIDDRLFALGSELGPSVDTKLKT